jgi:hypothetical protein
VNSKAKIWRVGIDKPDDGVNQKTGITEHNQMEGKSISTSEVIAKFYEKMA